MEHDQELELDPTAGAATFSSPFLTRLFDVVSTPDTDHAIVWSLRGDSIVIGNLEASNTNLDSEPKPKPKHKPKPNSNLNSNPSPNSNPNSNPNPNPHPSPSPYP